MEKISFNSKGYNNRLGYLKSLTMRIRKSIHKLKNNKTFENFRTKVILIDDLED